MGQKVHPYGFRLGYNKNWLSRWFSKKDYPAFVFEDSNIRKFVKKSLYHAGISKIEIERAGGKIRLIIHTARLRHRHRPQGVRKLKRFAATSSSVSVGSSRWRSMKSAVPKSIPSWWPRTSPCSLNAAWPSAGP